MSRPRSRFPTVRRVLACMVVVAFAFALTQSAAHARPGGGGSFRGGSSSSGRSSSSPRSSGGISLGSRGSSPGYSPGYSTSSDGYGGGGGAIDLFAFLFGAPVVALVFIVLIFVMLAAVRSKQQAWSSGGGRPLAPRRNPRRELDRIAAFDPNFSAIIFEDFLYALYAEVARAQGDGQLQRVSAYLGPEASAALEAAPRAAVANVIVGAMTIVDVAGVEPNADEVAVDVAFEANFSAGGKAYYGADTWQIARSHSARSRTPETARVLGCPHCGAPQTSLFGGSCRYCNQVVNNGAFDWVVRAIAHSHREERPPILTSESVERAYEIDAPTQVDSDAATGLDALASRDREFVWAAFQRRVVLIFGEFQTAWAARDLAKMRPYLSDALFEAQVYWTESYKAQRLRNITENTSVTNIVLARIGRDAFFDSITVRVFAIGLDYTLSDDGKLVSGSRSRPRAYSEYWTLIRSAKRQGATSIEKQCPNCGSPLAINMSGQCPYCQAKVTTGEFDWVLSRIEQDEVYAG